MPDCNTCRESREVISRHTHESDMDRMERVNKRLFWALMISLVLFVASWAGFIWYESQWEYFETAVTQENAGGFNNYNYIGNDGDISYGEKAFDQTGYADGDHERPEA